MVLHKNTVRRFAARDIEEALIYIIWEANLFEQAIMFSCMGKKPKKQEQNKQKTQQQEQRTVLGNSATTNKPAPNVAGYAMAPPPPTKKTLEPMGFRAGEAHCDIDVSYRRNSC